MKHWTIRILLCLILGAVTTVAVAWGIAMLGQTEVVVRWAEITNADRRWWLEHLPDTLDPKYVRARSQWTFSGIGIDERLVFGKPALLDGPNNSGRSVRLGLPVRAMEYNYWTSYIGDPIRYHSPSGVLWWPESPKISYAERRVRVLPVHPLWPGFLIDTFFYGGIWFGLLFGISAVRRGIRRRRGRCANCGYDLRGQKDHRRDASATSGGISGGGCPECGWGRE